MANYRHRVTNTEQLKWMETIATWYHDVGFKSQGLNNSWYHCQLHHVGGRKLKQNKVPIGGWFILPLPVRLHDVNSNHPHSVTHHKNAFTDRFGLQSELFKEMIESMVESGATLPFGDDVIDAIEDTRR